MDSTKLFGRLEIYRVRNNIRELVYEKKNTLNVTLYTNLRTVLISRSVEYGVDAIAWGSYKDPAGSFIDSDYAGTTSTGTQGGLVQSAVGSLQSKFSGTFSFTTTKSINFFELGRGYTPAAGGVTQLFSGRYAYDNSLLTGSTSIQYVNGDSLIVDWTIQAGS